MKRIALLLWLLLPVSGFAQWKASLELTERIVLQCRTVVIYTNGAESITQEYRFDGSDISGQLQAQVKAQLAKLTAIDSAVATFKLGPITIAPDPVPTQDQIDQQGFLILLKDWQTKKAIVEEAAKTGLSTKVTQQDVDSALSAWKAVYKDTYAPFIVGLF